MAMINNVIQTTGDNGDKTSVTLEVRENTDGTISIKSNGTPNVHTTQIYTFDKEQATVLVKILRDFFNI